MEADGAHGKLVCSVTKNEGQSVAAEAAFELAAVSEGGKVPHGKTAELTPFMRQWSGAKG